MSALMFTGSLRHSFKERENDCYETPLQAINALMRCELLPNKIWEPACGPGAIVRPLRAAGHDVIASDLIDYGLENSVCDRDFLKRLSAPPDVSCIVTNPPYKLADAFVRQSLNLVPTSIMLLRLAYLEGSGRSDIIDNHLNRVWLGKERLPMMHRHGWDGPKINAGAMPFAWFVFTREKTNGAIDLRRMSWRK